MRRLPIYFVLDCSESMAGDKLKKVESGVSLIIQKLKKDPQSLETVYFSIITFAGISRTLSPLIEISHFYPPKLPLGGGTSLGLALNNLMKDIDSNTIKSTIDKKGDWKPIVYLWTDGKPTDNVDEPIKKWRKNYASKVNLIAIGMGNIPDFAVLKELTENVLHFENSNSEDFNKFVNWISSSIAIQSKAIEKNNQKDELIIDESILKIIKEPPSSLKDENCLTFVGRCQFTKRPYLLKYEKNEKKLSTKEFNLNIDAYIFDGCHILEESYFEWSDPRSFNNSVSTSSLIGGSSCPHCSSTSTFAVCACGKFLCTNGPGNAECPWCNQNILFKDVKESEDGFFEVRTGRG